MSTDQITSSAFNIIMESVTQPTLESLPAEIRLQIYGELLLTPHIISITEKEEHCRDQGILSSLLLVSKVIRSEVQDWPRRTRIPHQDGLRPDMRISYFSIFNADVTTFRIETIRWESPVTQDFKLLSLWHLLAIVYQCDSNKQLTLSSYVPKDRSIDRNFMSYFDREHSWSDMCPNWAQLTKTLHAEFNQEFRYETQFPDYSNYQNPGEPLYHIAEYCSADVTDQLLRIPYSYHNALKDQNLTAEQLVRKVCELEEARVGDAHNISINSRGLSDSWCCYIGDDWMKYTSWSFFDHKNPWWA